MHKKSYAILVVDDSRDFRNLLSNYLAQLPCDVVYAHDGEDAVALCESRRFDLIIMDIIMPLMDGVDAIRAIRRQEVRKRRPKTPILALSAESSIQTGVDSMDAGATRMLVKPVTCHGFLEIVRDMFGEGH